MTHPYLTDNLFGMMIQMLPEPNLALQSAPDDEDKPVQFSNRLRRRYKRQLSNLARRTFKSEQQHIDQALAAYLAQQKPEDLRDIPAE